MSDPTIPLATRKAAKRGFIRTASQSIATALGGGITVNAVLLIINGGDVDWTVLAVTGGVAIATPLINGAQSYFSILSKGIPDDYAVAVTAEQVSGFTDDSTGFRDKPSGL